MLAKIYDDVLLCVLTVIFSFCKKRDVSCFYEF